MSSFKKRMLESSAGKSRIILANDLIYDNADKLESKTLLLINKLNKYICAVKFNFHLILPLGEKKLAKINKVAHDVGLQTIADIKLNDIGNTNIVSIKRLWNCGFDAVIANPIMGPENLNELTKNAHSARKGVIALVHMSHPGARSGYGLRVLNSGGKQVGKIHDLFLKWSLSSSVDGIVVGATVPEIISSASKCANGLCDIYSPGVGTQGGDPRRALKAGSNYLIVGRTILKSKNLISETKRLQDLSLNFDTSA